MVSASSLLRELLIRTSITLIVALAAFFFLNAGVWVFALPIGVALLIGIKWLLRPRPLGDD